MNNQVENFMEFRRFCNKGSKCYCKVERERKIYIAQCLQSARDETEKRRGKKHRWFCCEQIIFKTCKQDSVNKNCTAKRQQDIDE